MKKNTKTIENNSQKSGSQQTTTFQLHRMTSG